MQTSPMQLSISCICELSSFPSKPAPSSIECEKQLALTDYGRKSGRERYALNNSKLSIQARNNLELEKISSLKGCAKSSNTSFPRKNVDFWIRVHE